MEHSIAECAFCDTDSLSERIIRAGEYCVSFVSRPWFRPGHCLVVPRRHIETLDTLTPQESVALLAELGRLTHLLDSGYGAMTMQKYQTLQPQDGIKMNHLHFHVLPRFAHETGVFHVSDPQHIDDFSIPTLAQISELQRNIS